MTRIAIIISFVFFCCKDQILVSAFSSVPSGYSLLTSASFSVANRNAGLQNTRMTLMPLPLQEKSYKSRRSSTSISMAASNTESENSFSSRNRAPYTLTKDTEWKLTLSLTGPPQDGQFGPGKTLRFFAREGGFHLFLAVSSVYLQLLFVSKSRLRSSP